MYKGTFLNKKCAFIVVFLYICNTYIQYLILNL